MKKPKQNKTHHEVKDFDGNTVACMPRMSKSKYEQLLRAAKKFVPGMKSAEHMCIEVCKVMLASKVRAGLKLTPVEHTIWYHEYEPWKKK